MKVDYKVKVAPSYNVGYILHRGPYTGPNMWRSEFNQLTKWAKRRELRTGKWIMYFLDKWSEKSERQRRSVACIEIKGKAKPRPEGRIQIMKIPRQKVVSVVFDPDKVSADLVYYALEAWIEYGPYKQAALSRELYDGSPWTNPRAWANCEAQVPLKRKSRT
jgi:effector-binding domain-containing protein